MLIRTKDKLSRGVLYVVCAADLYRPCTQSEFLCDECRCLSLALKCNGNQDCRDATDEDNCSTTHTYLSAMSQCFLLFLK